MSAVVGSVAEAMAELREAVAKLTPAEVAAAMRQLEGVMAASPPDVDSATDRQIRYGLGVLTAGYRLGAGVSTP